MGWEVTAFEVLPDDRGIGRQVAYVQRSTRRGALKAARRMITSPPVEPKPKPVWSERYSF
jgi:hypothetical protein